MTYQLDLHTSTVYVDLMYFGSSLNACPHSCVAYSTLLTATCPSPPGILIPRCGLSLPLAFCISLPPCCANPFFPLPLLLPPPCGLLLPPPCSLSSLPAAYPSLLPAAPPHLRPIPPPRSYLSLLSQRGQTWMMMSGAQDLMEVRSQKFGEIRSAALQQGSIPNSVAEGIEKVVPVNFFFSLPLADAGRTRTSHIAH